MTLFNGVIYCRVSTVEQVEGYSLRYQESECRKYAENNDINIVECFIERGESAKNDNRAELHPRRNKQDSWAVGKKSFLGDSGGRVGVSDRGRGICRKSDKEKPL